MQQALEYVKILDVPFAYPEGEHEHVEQMLGLPLD